MCEYRPTYLLLPSVLITRNSSNRNRSIGTPPPHLCNGSHSTTTLTVTQTSLCRCHSLRHSHSLGCSCSRLNWGLLELNAGVLPPHAPAHCSLSQVKYPATVSLCVSLCGVSVCLCVCVCVCVCVRYRVPPRAVHVPDTPPPTGCGIPPDVVEYPPLTVHQVRAYVWSFPGWTAPATTTTSIHNTRGRFIPYNNS